MQLNQGCSATRFQIWFGQKHSITRESTGVRKAKARVKRRSETLLSKKWTLQKNHYHPPAKTGSESWNNRFWLCLVDESLPTPARADHRRHTPKTKTYATPPSSRMNNPAHRQTQQKEHFVLVPEQVSIECWWSVQVLPGTPIIFLLLFHTERALHQML